VITSEDKNMSKKLYLECYSGISGDMMVGALLDLGADQDVLQQALHSLPVQGFHTTIGRVTKSGLDACDFVVILDATHENHDHDMEYLHGKDQHHDHDADHHHHNHGHDHHHNHDHDAEHHHGHAQPHEHRGLTDILTIIEQADMTARAKEIAARIFEILAKAEAQAHGVEVDQVHFHEVGAVDSIVDIVAAAVCFDNLGITDVIVPVLYEGSGFVRCQHGMIPIPVPAVTHIAANHGLRLHLTRTEGEFVTPTGAAIVAAIRTSEALP
jgi:pyridinium-3,5-bisthiocarboxylic acid mononucleotide nickel chelatase